MPGRTTNQLLARLLAFLPPQYATATPLLAGLAAAMEAAEAAGDSLAGVLPIGPYTVQLPDGTIINYPGAEGIWLDLHGFGTLRTTGELDPAYRVRLRNVEDAVTRPAILGAVDRLLEPFGVTATMVEWWDEPFLDVEDDDGMWLDSTFISGGPQSFVIVVPVVGLGFAVSPDPYLDVDAYLDDMYLGEQVEDPIYAAIVAEVERLRAAGVRWRMYIGAPA